MEYVNAIKIKMDVRMQRSILKIILILGGLSFFLLLRDKSLRLWTLGAFSLGLALCKKFPKKWFIGDFCP